MPELKGEFQLIEQIRRQTQGEARGVELGIGDDAAVLSVPEGHHLVAATDTLNIGIHFPADTTPFDIGYKCLAVNLSDLAAMGATPQWALLSLSLPEFDPGWLKSFTAGFQSLAQSFNVSLVGGDTTCGPLSVNVTALGSIEPGRQLQRGGARPGDLVVVSGTIGGAARVLDLLTENSTKNSRSGGNKSGSNKAEQPQIDRKLLDRPQPRVPLGKMLTGHATACIDVSDGLLADLSHMLNASGCAAQIETQALPAPEILTSLENEQKWTYQLAGGDDYELLFTLPANNRKLLSRWSKKLNIKLTVIGEITGGRGITCLAPDDSPFYPTKSGWDHFGRTE